MPVFYNKQKAIHGTMTGSIISFPVQLIEDDPKGPNNLDILPAGYLRCDGRVLFAVEYPELAQVLGVGPGTKFLKEGQVITNEQFQLPDLRNKHIRATTSANIGLYNDLIVEDGNGNEVYKSGVGLDVVQNIESPFQLQYTGDFYIPPQVVDLRGEPAFTVDTGVYTYETETPANAFQPHMHRTNTTRARQQDKNGNFFSARQINHVRTLSSLNVCQWWENTAQPLCYHMWENLSVDGLSAAPDTVTQGTTDYQYYGACFTGCTNFSSSGYCLWPQAGGFCPEVNNQSFDFRLESTGTPGPCNEGNSGNGDSVTVGNITYDPNIRQVCNCNTIVFGLCPGGYLGQSSDSVNSNELTSFGPDYGNPNTNMPFTVYDSEYTLMPSGVNNITVLSGEFGSDGLHRHRLDFRSDEAHTFQMRTRAATARADSGLVSRITIDRNREPKADKYIQPYVVTEYLIKV